MYGIEPGDAFYWRHDGKGWFSVKLVRKSEIEATFGQRPNVVETAE
jgi:hypothetical protein